MTVTFTKYNGSAQEWLCVDVLSLEYSTIYDCDGLTDNRQMGRLFGESVIRDLEVSCDREIAQRICWFLFGESYNSLNESIEGGSFLICGILPHNIRMECSRFDGVRVIYR